MADAYWTYGKSSRQQAVSLPPVKRLRTNYEMQTSGHHVTDTDLLNASYECYLRSLPGSSYGVEIGNFIGQFDELPEIDDLDDLRILTLWGSKTAPAAPSLYVGVERALGASNPIGVAPSKFMGASSRFMRVGGSLEIPFPPNASGTSQGLLANASSTLLVQGLPANLTRREVSHLFRPFVGYKDVRLVIKEAIHSGGDPVVLCFVDFQCPAHAATAMDALQGYIFDDHDRDSGCIRLQFACSPSARSWESLRLI